MGKPRLPRGPRTLTREQLAQAQESEIARLYGRLEKAGRPREWLDRVIAICRTPRGDAGLLDNERKLADRRRAELEKIDKYAELVHQELHQLLASAAVSCSPKNRRACASLRPALAAHFRFWHFLQGELTSAQLRALRLRTRRAFYSEIPASAQTSGGAAALLFEKYGFKHREIALLVCSVEATTPLPIAEGVLKAKTSAVKTAIHALPADRDPWVRHVLAPKRRSDRRR